MPISDLPTLADVQAARVGQPILKARARVLDRIEKKAALAKQERACRRAVDARDHRRCFFPRCQLSAGEKHHIQPRSLGGKWQTWNILSACGQHHRYFKAGLIAVIGNPDFEPVLVQLTALGTQAGLRIPRTQRENKP